MMKQKTNRSGVLLQRFTAILLCLCFSAACQQQQQAKVLNATIKDARASDETIKTDDYEGLIVSERRAAEYFQAINGLKAESYWTPSKEQVVELESGIEDYLRRVSPRQSKELWRKIKSYRRQYIGIVQKNRKIIVARFFCESFDDWQKPKIVNDGGDCFFSVHYGAESGDYGNLNINGEA